MQVWASMFCMGNPNKKLPQDIVPLYFDDDDDEEESVPALTEEERAGLQADIDAWNAMQINQSETR